MYYTVIKHSGHLRTLEKCRKHSPAARVVYTSLVFSNARRVLSQCNTRLRLLYLLNKCGGRVYLGIKCSMLSTNLKICNFLDVTLNLTDGTYYPYRKPDNETLYIDSNSNHPPTIIKHPPVALGRRISDISSSKKLFN